MPSRNTLCSATVLQSDFYSERSSLKEHGSSVTSVVYSKCWLRVCSQRKRQCYFLNLEHLQHPFWMHCMARDTSQAFSIPVVLSLSQFQLRASATRHLQKEAKAAMPDCCIASLSHQFQPLKSCLSKWMRLIQNESLEGVGMARQRIKG